MANNNKFNDVAVGYRPQTAFPLNANEYFESFTEASAAAAAAAEVGTPEANRTSYYIGQVLTVHETKRPIIDRPAETREEFMRISRSAVDQKIPVVMFTIKGSVASPDETDEHAVNLASWLSGDIWQQYVQDNSNRFYFVYGQTDVDQAVFDSISNPVAGQDPLAEWYGASDWNGAETQFDKIGVIYNDGSNSYGGFTSVSDSRIEDASGLSEFINDIIGSVERMPAVSLYQIQPDKTLVRVGSGEGGEIAVDGVTIKQNIDTKEIYVDALPDKVIDNYTIKKSGGKLYVASIPKSQLAGYVETSTLTGYVETPGRKEYRIRLDPNGKAYVSVPWEKGEGGGGGGEAVQADVLVDNVTIGKKPDGTIYLKSVPDEKVEHTCVLFKDWTVPPLGKIRLLSRDGGWQCYTYSDISAQQGDAKSLAYMENENVAAPFSSNEFLRDSENLIALDVGDAHVLSIGSDAFRRCEALSSVACRAVLSVGEYAFAECASLTEAKFPGAERIQAGAFYAAEALSAVECPFAYDIGDFAFSGCGGLVSIACRNLQTVGRAAFESCAALMSIDCRDVIQAGPGAFSGCSSLKSVSMYRLSALESGVFSGCAGLTSVFAPSVSGQIQPSAFMNCSSLSGIGVWNATGVGVSAFAGCQALSGIRSNDIAEIGKYAFADCVSISSMNLPSVKVINESAFEGCGVMSVILSGAADADGIPAVFGNSFDGIPQTVSVYVLGGMKEEFEAVSYWQALEDAETSGHKKIKIIELNIGAGDSTVYTDASGNRLESVTLIRDGDAVIRDLM